MGIEEIVLGVSEYHFRLWTYLMMCLLIIALYLIVEYQEKIKKSILNKLSKKKVIKNK